LLLAERHPWPMSQGSAAVVQITHLADSRSRGWATGFVVELGSALGMATLHVQG
jgi:hypothetical protein